jgi:hypothetical protein
MQANTSKELKTDKSTIDTTVSAKRLRPISSYLVIGASAFAVAALLPEIALASKFDIDAGITAATNPLIKGISDHWGKGVLLTGCGGAILGEGDARQRAVRAGMASAAAGGVVLALLAMFT